MLVGFGSFVHLHHPTERLLGGKSLALGGLGAPCLVGSGCEQVSTWVREMDV